MGNSWWATMTKALTIKGSLRGIAATLVVATTFGCAEKKPEPNKIAYEKAIKEFVASGPRVTTQTPIAEGILSVIELPIQDGQLAYLKRCVLFVSSTGNSNLQCEEPQIYFPE